MRRQASTQAGRVGAGGQPMRALANWRLRSGTGAGVAALDLAAVSPGTVWRGATAENALTVEEQQLVDRCLTGDAAAWETILQQHGRRIYNLCYRFTGRAEDAEDLAQEVCLRIYRNLASFRVDQGSLRTWIISLTRNLLIDHYRRRKYDRLTDSLDSAPPGAEDNAAPRNEPAAPGARQQEAGLWRREIREHVQRALTRLSPELREAIILRDLQDMDYKEIAQLLRIPEGTVKSRINRGRIELARLLKPRLSGRPEPPAGTVG